MIDKNTEMLLFRFGEFKHYDFIEEHTKIINEHGYVWVLKSGRKSNPAKIKEIINQGGWIILKQPKNAGGKYYIGQFVNVQEEEPTDQCYPNYYEEFFFFFLTNEQWFKITSIAELNSNDIEKIVLCKNGNRVVDIIGTTMTSVMFVKNCEVIDN